MNSTAVCNITEIEMGVIKVKRNKNENGFSTIQDKKKEKNA